MTTLTPLRHERDRQTIVGRLTDVSEAAVDMVAPASALDYHVATSQLDLAEPYVTSDGVYDSLPVTFTRNAFRQLVTRGDIPLRYADLLFEQDTDLLAHNVNERNHHLGTRGTLYRMLRQGDHWVVRAVMSDRYGIIDNVDMLTAISRGLMAANVNLEDCEVEADWSDDRFGLRIAVPGIALAVPDLLGDYRTPWSTNPADPVHAPNLDGSAPPVIWAGLEASNSETGNGAMTLTPRALVEICRNGLTRKEDLLRSIHLGARLGEGVVKWSDDTRRQHIQLITSQVRDAASQFCSVEYLNSLADEMRRAKGTEVLNIPHAFEVAQNRLGFTDDEVKDAMSMFMRSGDQSVLGLGQAFTAAAQIASTGERQTEMEQTFWDIVATPEAFVG